LASASAGTRVDQAARVGRCDVVGSEAQCFGVLGDGRDRAARAIVAFDRLADDVEAGAGVHHDLSAEQVERLMPCVPS
jgi:hypothetical protein